MTRKNRFRTGDTVLLDIEPPPGVTSLRATVIAYLGQGESCDKYVVACRMTGDLPKNLEVCSCVMYANSARARDFYLTVPWDEMPWRPNLDKLPAMISLATKQARKTRLQGRK